MVIHNVAAALQRDGQRGGDDGAWQIDGAGRCARTSELVDLIVDRRRATTTTARSTGPGRAIGTGTVNAFVRRLLSSQRAASAT